MSRPAFCICENKDADQLRGYCFAVTAKLISVFVFAIWIVQYLYFLNPKFLASSHLLWLYSPVCVGPDWKLEDRFSHNEAHIIMLCINTFVVVSSIHFVFALPTVQYMTES